MTRNPTDIRSTPINVRIFEVKNPFAGDMGVEVIAACGVDDSLRFARTARGVENEEHIFAVHRFGGTIGGNLAFEVMPPMIPTFYPVNLCFAALNN